MPTVYKVRDQDKRCSRFFDKAHSARQEASSRLNCSVEPLDYTYKWQITQMLNDAYLEGEYDVSSRMD